VSTEDEDADRVPLFAGNAQYLPAYSSARTNAGPAQTLDEPEPNSRPLRREPIANSRYRPLPTNPARPVSPAPDLPPREAADAEPSPTADTPEPPMVSIAVEPVAWADTEAWVARLRAAATVAAADADRDSSISEEFSAGSQLPRRNARPVSGP
jgi:hypothetical protein